MNLVKIITLILLPNEHAERLSKKIKILPQFVNLFFVILELKQILGNKIAGLFQEGQNCKYFW